MSAADAVRGRFADLTRAEQGVAGFVVLLAALLLFGLVTGGLAPTYFLYLVGLVGMYVLLSFGLNVQWGYTGLINFSVAAFFGIGAYGTALLTAGNSPVGAEGWRFSLAGVELVWVSGSRLYGLLPVTVLGLLFAVALAAAVAVAIGIPTLRLRADYLAIASLGLAEVVRLIFLNQRDVTNGSAGLRGLPGFFEGWPVLGTLPQTLPGIQVHEVALPGFGSTRLLGFTLGAPFWQALLNVGIVLTMVAVVFAVLRRVHRSPWGRVLRTIRSDEDLAKALGKDTYAFKMQSFVLGSVIMALAGVFYAHLNLFVSPGDLEPINTFYVWIAVILGGSGSNRGAIFGGFVVIAIREGTRFLGEVLPASFPVDVPLVTSTYATVVNNFASTRLLAVGLLIILVMRFRPQGVLPPQRELIWPSSVAASAGPGETNPRETVTEDAAAGAHDADSGPDAEPDDPATRDGGGDDE
ncbi:branched-chain amino acid ABC transporter permease [Halobaculum sp. WSA2]|uniref:Branched-chain amino acid ABC transporter permease n=1 Tax=Halobaculum saliterrae TaxID=2073113 RepID=A0A6B0T0J9_9EURY|nr:branched-chain amino acid ABC transporter permease [Halobaculum saliterrae]MXR41760.1 branched-chain amino acid ABC transporter permease [Halobaculum saliterrae]